jgi:hypothetical protein
MPEMRDMPEDFAPLFSDDGRTTSWTWLIDGWGPDPWGVTFGFENDPDPEKQARLKVCLRETAWQVCEMVRLRQMEPLLALVDRQVEAGRCT